MYHAFLTKCDSTQLLHPNQSMIFEGNLKKHISICPKAKKRKRQEEEPYFLENVNCGGHGELVANSVTPVSFPSGSSFVPGSMEWAQRIACRVLRIHQMIFQNDKTCDVTSLTCDGIHSAIDLQDMSQPEIDAGIEDGFLSHHVKSGGIQHTTQIASLIGHLRQMGFLKPQNDQRLLVRDPMSPSKTEKPLVIMEMGAGRGMFGLTAAGVANAGGANTHFFMVDRAGARSKADKAFRTIPKNTNRSYMDLEGVDWCRLCCDVSHVNLPVVIEKDSKYDEAEIVVIAKHLCGAGTDLALKSLVPIRDKISALLIATCCHGICDWKHYVGRDVLRDIMEGKEYYDDANSNIPLFGPGEFDLLRRWSGATVATRESGKSKTNTTESSAEGDDIEHSIVFDEKHTTSEVDNIPETSISAVVRQLGLSCTIQGLGRACQRLIDFGRSEYIHQNIFQDKDEGAVANDLAYYVSPEITPQNAILKAYRKEKNS